MAQTTRSRIDAAKHSLEQFGQQHIIRFAEQLERPQLLNLLDTIESLDLPFIQQLVERYVGQAESHALPSDITPPPVYPLEPTPDLQQKYQQALERGERLIADRKVAAFTVAGGMGTRLSFDGPKGCLPATPVRNKPLFRLFAESLIATSRRYNTVVPWYIMTSRANHQETIAFFEDNDFFQLGPDNVYFFKQGMLPCFDRNGKILLDQPHQLAMSPDGHGGSLRALYNSKATEDMARRGVEYISYFQVDNPLVRTIDPLFIGLHALDNAEMSSKAVIKADPLEKVGNFALVDDKVHVIEYSDLPDELAHRKDPQGQLLFTYGSIAIHIISRSFVERLNLHGFSLPFHRAIKKVPYIDEQGLRVEPEKPNALKLETFVFDALPLAEKSVTLAIDRDAEFAPIKNAAGTDSLQTSHQLQIARAARWLEHAGLDVPRKPDNSVDALIEISPLFALDADELTQKKSLLRPLNAGDIAYVS